MAEPGDRVEAKSENREVRRGGGEDRTSHNFISTVSRLADDNLTIVRNVSTGLAVAGLIVIARSIRLMTKFQTASEIPARFIEKNISLRGKVCTITERGLEVEHVPIYVPGLSPLLSKPKGVCQSPLVVHLAGVDLTPEGKVWLRSNVAPDQSVWFKLISREDDVLHCVVSRSRGSVWSRCVNEEVLKLGLARSAPLVGVLPGSPLYWRLHKRLHRAEVKAQKKGRGLWKEASWRERLSRTITDTPFFRWIRRLRKWS